MDDLVDSAHASHANSLIAPCEIITRGPSHTVGTCLRYLSVIITYRARCIKERSSGLRKSCEALLNATPAPTGALQVFLEHKKRRTRRFSHVI